MLRFTTLLAGFFLLAFSASAQQEAIFEGLGHFPGGSVDSSVATAVSADGSTVVGFGISDNGQEAFRWTESGGMQGLGTLGGALSEAQAVSADGSIVIGWANDADNNAEAFRWEDGTMGGLGFLGSVAFTSLAFDVSADGSVVAGWSLGDPPSPQTFLWEDGTMVGLGDLPGDGLVSEGHGISADGAVVVGYGSTDTGPEAFRWEDDTMVGLGSLTGGAPNSWAEAVSADGAVVVGYSGSTNGPEEAFRWTQVDGMTGLGDLEGGAFQSRALAVSADGATIVGWGTTIDGQEAFIWTEEEGMRNLRDVLETDYGLDLTGWTLASAGGVSSTGNVIVGFGINPDGNTEAWRANLSPGGTPSIEVQPTALDFGGVPEGGETMRSITILNNGDDLLEVTNISSDNPVFSSSVTGPFTVVEGDSASVSVTFSPEGLGIESGVLTIESNAPEGATVSLEGEGVPPPAIAVGPDSLSQEVEIGSTATLPGAITVSNEGEGPLSFTAAFVQDTNLGAQLMPEDVAAGWFGLESSASYDPSAWQGTEGPQTGGTEPQGFNESVYQLDDGSTEAGLGLTNGGDVMWMNAFEVTDGFGTLTEISTAWGCAECPDGDPPVGHPATVFVYEDPNDDGNPSDAVLLTTVETEVQDPATDLFTTVPIEATPVDGIFFIAVLYRNQTPDVFPSPLDLSSPFQNASWIVGHTVQGEFDEENLLNNSNPPTPMSAINGFDGNWLLRADGSSDIVAVAPAAGEISPGGSLALDVQFSATALELGAYTGDIDISSNDPASPETSVATQMDVVTAPYPFALSPEALELEINLAEGDSTTTAPLTITNATEEEKFFRIETHGAAGNMPPEVTDILAYGGRRPGPNGQDFVSFNLNSPGNFTSLGSSPLVFGADFLLGDDETLYVLAGPPNNNGFFAFNVETGELTEIVASLPPPSGFIWAGLAGDPTNGTLYAASASTLYIIDPETGELEVVGDFGDDFNLVSIAIDSEGQMYGHNTAPYPASSRLVSVDKETGVATDIGPTGFATTFIQGMDFDLMSGELYMAACTNLEEGGCAPDFRIADLETGTTEIITTWGRNDMVDGLAFSSTPFIFVDTPLLSGTLAPGGSLTIDANVDARNLLPDTYDASLVVISDVPGQPEQVVPVTLEVSNTIADEVSPEEVAEGLTLPNPNPVRTTTTFSIAVQESQDVTVEIFDVTGRRVQTLYEGALASETSETLTLDASNLSAGVYVIRASGEDFAKTQRVTVLR